MKDLYSILGVKRGASAEEIKKSYRRIARSNHPDINKDPKAEERFKQASQAFEVLSDPEKRKLYDEFGEDGLRAGFDPDKARAYQQWQSRGFGGGGFGTKSAGGHQEVNLEDLLGMFGGGFDASPFQGARSGSSRTRDGADVEAEVQLELRDVVLGAEREISFIDPNGKSKSLRVKIPVGIDQGQTIRLSGQGRPGQHGGAHGSLLLRVRLAPHATIERNGNDLSMKVPVTAVEALRGGPIQVPTYHGNVTLKIPPGSQNGSKLRLRSKGISPPNAPAGDLFVVLDVRLPDSAPEDLLTQLETLYSGDIRNGLQL